MNEHDLDQAFTAYQECAEWSSPNWDDQDEYGNPSPLDEVGADWTPLLIESSRCELSEFWDAAQSVRGSEWWTPEQFAHDFWLTRNGHGAGFWDRGQGATGEALTAMAKVYGEVNLYVNQAGLIDGE